MGPVCTQGKRGDVAKHTSNQQKYAEKKGVNRITTNGVDIRHSLLSIGTTYRT